AVSVAIEQFGYGFGFTAYMLYTIYISEGEHKTSNYAIGTGFMALGMMLPGMWSGWLQDIIGYQNFFIWVMISTIPCFLAATWVKIDANFGKKE
ncbi:MAG: MFS transporter, partial [Bacteroidetes bacterium]